MPRRPAGLVSPEFNEKGASMMAPPEHPGQLPEPEPSPDSPDDLLIHKTVRACWHPVRLAGSRHTIDRRTGEILAPAETAVTWVRCGNRRARVCRPCSTIYKYDAYHLVASGLRGGKGVPTEVADAPRLFVTLTAPSFGPVHLGPGKGGALRTCHPSRRGGLACGVVHLPQDPAIVSPLDPDAYDYAGQVLFNAHAGALWSRFTTEVRRALAEAGGISRSRLREQACVSFAKVAEFQARGVVHFHAVIRLDGPDGPGSEPAPWASTNVLDVAVHAAAQRAWVATPSAKRCPARRLAWGIQVDVRPVADAEDQGGLSDAAVARYVAKYATKSTESAGLELPPLFCRSCQGTGRAGERWCRVCHGHGLREGGRLLRAAALSPHARRIVEVCWQLGTVSGLERLKLRRWAHMLGFRGHFATVSRSFSTTFGALRAERAAFTELVENVGTDASQEAELFEAATGWRYAGRGEVLPVTGGGR